MARSSAIVITNKLSFISSSWHQFASPLSPFSRRELRTGRDSAPGCLDERPRARDRGQEQRYRHHEQTEPHLFLLAPVCQPPLAVLRQETCARRRYGKSGPKAALRSELW